MPTFPNPYDQALPKNAANYAPLSPISFIGWAADVFPDHCAVIHGDLRMSWRIPLVHAARDQHRGHDCDDCSRAACM